MTVTLTYQHITVMHTLVLILRSHEFLFSGYMFDISHINFNHANDYFTQGFQCVINSRRSAITPLNNERGGGWRGGGVLIDCTQC